MTTSYQQCDLAHAAPGMILSDDLLDQYGKMLLPHGTILSTATLAALRRHGVEILPILCSELSDAEVQAQQHEYQKRLTVLFRKHSSEENGTSAASLLLKQYIFSFRLGEQA